MTVSDARPDAMSDTTPDSKIESAIRWQDNRLWLLDQRALPTQQSWIVCEQVDQVVQAIRNMVVRGAPAIGITAAYGVVLAAMARSAAWREGPEVWSRAMAADIAALAASRPTAVNLFWALERMRRLLTSCLEKNAVEDDVLVCLLREAKCLHESDVQANRTMGRLGAALMAEYGMHSRGVMTHCNAGMLATGGYGTALGVIRSAWQAGLVDRVFANETRPWWQGARLTAWELAQDRIPVTLNVDSVAAVLMQQRRIDWVVVGADRVAANGDVANKIGTYNLAVLARQHGVRMMVVAPSSTFDLQISRGADIPIEERGAEEVIQVQGQVLAPAGINVYNPVFDVTPASLIDAIVTEKGVIEQPDGEQVARLFQRTPLH